MDGLSRAPIVAYENASDKYVNISLPLSAPSHRHVNKQQGSLRLLQKAKLLTSRGQPYLGNTRLQARAVTLNNLGCLMKQWGKPRVGIAFLARALRIEAEVPGDADNPAGTHLNMSAALSTVGMHRAAAAHAGYAIGLASQAMRTDQTDNGGAVAGGGETPSDDDVGGGGSMPINSTGSSSVHPDPVEGDGGPESFENHADTGIAGMAEGETGLATGDDGRTTQERLPRPSSGREDRERRGDADENKTPPCGSAKNGIIPVGPAVAEGGSLVDDANESRAAAGGLLAVAYFNLAVEREHLDQPAAALSAYKSARVAAGRHLGPESPVAKGIEQAALEVASAAATEAAAVISDSRRGATRSGVDSFPSIGKLRFSPRSPRLDGAATNPDSSEVSSPRRSKTPRRMLAGSANNAVEANHVAVLAQAYNSPRPFPHPPTAPPRWASCTGRRGPAPPPRSARRWTKCSTAPSHRETKAQSGAASSIEHGSRSRVGRRYAREAGGGLLWRAQACSLFGCSPHEAMRAQQAEMNRLEDDVQHDSPSSLSPRWIE